MTEWHDRFREAEANLIQGGLPLAQNQPVGKAGDPPKMKESWETEIDEFIASNNGEFDIKLERGSVLRVSKNTAPATDAVVIDADHFKKLARLASKFNGKIVHIQTKAQASHEFDEKVKNKEGFWIKPGIFIEMDREKIVRKSASNSSQFGLVAAPKPPLEYPAVDPNVWVTMDMSNILDQVPMRVGSRVLGTLVKTKYGNIYTKNAKSQEHVLQGVSGSWTVGGAYTIDREMFGKYLTEPSAVIKFVRDDFDKSIYLTTADHIRQFGGLIKNWGKERVVMPLSGKYWMRVDMNGQIIEG